MKTLTLDSNFKKTNETRRRGGRSKKEVLDLTFSENVFKDYDVISFLTN